jgi:hypothetical protein
LRPHLKVYRKGRFSFKTARFPRFFLKPPPVNLDSLTGSHKNCLKNAKYGHI